MQPDNHGIAVSLTILLALACSLMPLSGDWIVWRPNFLLLVAMAWVFRWPNEFGVIFAASVGLLADIVMRTSVGHSILLFAFCAAAILLVARWIKYLSAGAANVTGVADSSPCRSVRGRHLQFL